MGMPKLLVTAIILVTVVIGFGGGYAEAPVEATEPQQSFTDFTGIRIYFSETRGEASRFDRTSSGISRLAGLLASRGAELYTLDWRSEIPAEADLVIIAGPLGDLADNLVARLWVYLKGGGRLLLLADPIPGNDRRVLSAEGTLFSLTWEDMGMRARDDVVASQGPVLSVRTVSTDEEGLEVVSDEPIEAATVQIEFTTSQLDTSHPITAAITSDIAFFGVRSLELDASSADLLLTPLIFSETDHFGETDLQVYDNALGGEFADEVDTPPGNLPLAAALADPATGTRIVLFGDREVATNGGGFQTDPSYSMSFVYPGNVQLLLNAAAWLLDAEIEPVALPTPVPED